MADSRAERIIPLGNKRFVHSKRAIVRGDQLISLSPNECKLLLYLADHAGEALTYRQLLTDVWGYNENVESRTIYSTVNRLRSKIERDPADPQYLLAVPGVGYRFVLAEPQLPDEDASDPRALVGRSDALARLLSLIETESLLVLLGTAGVGKTRLAAEATAQLAPRLPGGILRIDLGAVSDRDVMVASVASAIGVTGNRDRVQAIGRALADRGRCIVWLDEVERLTGTLSPITAWRALAPEAIWLLTSRLPTGIEGEVLFPVTPLSEADGLALLLRRGRIARPSLQPDELAALCSALDGIPLAIELAAARLGLLSPHDLHARLTCDLSVLRRRNDPNDRHASLEATLSFTWDLLDAHTQRTLAAASVFSGSFDLEAAETVLAAQLPGRDVLEYLEDLAACGLLRALAGPETRFALLETARAFAARKLADPDTFGTSAQRDAEIAHGAHYARLGDEDPARPERSSMRAEGLRVMANDQPNLLVATERAIARGDTQIAARVGYALVRVWQQSMPDRNTLALTERILATNPSGMLWCRIAHIRGVLLWSMGRLADAESQYREVIAQATSPAIEGIARSALGLVLNHLNHPLESLREHEHAVALMRSVGSPERLSRALVHLGAAYGTADRLLDAEHTYEEALQLARTSDLPGYEASVRGALVVLALHTDRPMEAMAHATAAVALADRTGNAMEMLGAKLHAVDAARCLGRTEDALTGAKDVIARARKFGVPATEGWAHLYTSQALLSAARYDDAALAGFAAVDAFREAKQSAPLGWAASITALALWRLGRLPEGMRAADDAIAHLEGRDPQILALALAVRATSAGSEGDADIARARALARGSARWALEATVLGLAAIVAVERARTDEARALRDEAEQAIRTHGWEPPGGLDVVMGVLRKKLGR